MISDKDNIGKLSSKQMQSIVKIAREAKSRTGKTVRLQDHHFFSKMAGILQQAGETELVQDLLLINDEVSVRDDQPAIAISEAGKTKASKSKVAAKPSNSNDVKTSEGFLTNLLSSNNTTQEKKNNAVTVKKYDRYKIKVKLFDQFPN